MSNPDKMGFNATWSMAVGGMVGGGIFSVLGVVVSIAGGWAWLSFVVAGAIALAAASSYSLLAEKFGEGGGAFTFLRDVQHEEFAGSVSWIVIVGYTLTIGVYAFTFGHYCANLFEVGPWFPRTAGAVLIAVLVGVNLRGVGSASIVEIVTVWGKLAVLCGLGIWGLVTWSPEQLEVAGTSSSLVGALIGAASVFMAYEGFQLLAYDYDDVEDAETTVPRAMITAIVSVIAVYLLVAFGSLMLVGGETLIARKEVALAVAGEQIAGTAGLWVVTIAALFSTASAINATLFAVARLAEDVADDGELPSFFAHENDQGIPNRAVLVLGGGAALLSIFGSLDLLVEAASLGFLLTFTVVNVLAFIEVDRRRVVSALGALGGLTAAVTLVWRRIWDHPMVMVVFVVIVLVATVGRHLLLDRAASSNE